MSAATKKRPDGPRFQVRTPAAGFRGQRAGLHFVEGVAHTDDEQVAQTCRDDLGYQVVDLHEQAELQAAEAAKRAAAAAKK